MSGLTKAGALPTEAAILSVATLTSPPTYIPIANTGDYTGPGSSYTEADVSAHGHRARRKITTLLDSGHVTFPLWFIPDATTQPSHTDHTNGLRAIHERGDLRAWKLSYNDAAGTARFFNAYVSKMAEKLPVAGVLSADVDFLIDDVILTGTDTGGLATAVFAPSE